MRKVLRRSIPPVDDEALLKRRRTIETAALVARGLAIVATALAAAGSGAGTTPGENLRLACWAGVVLMTLANIVAFVNHRRPGARWYKSLSAVQSGLDTTTILGIVVIATLENGAPTWPLLSLAIAVAALRHQLPGAVLVYAATSVGYTYFVPYTSELSFVVGLGLLIALITGAQSSALEHQLTELGEIRRELQHQATHDPMTGLPNRARLAGYADGCDGRPLTVLLLDLNGFKQVNDTYGHAAGDVLLHEIASRLTGVLDREGLVGRLGGDEFLVLLPDADIPAVARLVTRIRDVARQPVDVGDGRTVRVGISAGVAMRPAGAGTSLDALTAEADAAMYRDKRGRTAA